MVDFNIYPVTIFDLNYKKKPQDYATVIDIFMSSNVKFDKIKVKDLI